MAWAGAHVANRIVFTDVAPKSQHISRGRVCDLFLDTPECNAHTTAADILWSSTPLLTLPRYPIRCVRAWPPRLSRVRSPRRRKAPGQLASSLKTVTRSTSGRLWSLLVGSSYSVTSDGYGVGRGRLSEMRRMLFENRWTCALFEHTQMGRRRRAGLRRGLAEVGGRRGWGYLPVITHHVRSPGGLS